MAWVYHESNKAGAMSLEEMQNNATEFYNQLSSYGWTLNAVASTLGNVQRESFINPAQWQIGYSIGSTDAGFGLVQWTPSTNYTDWCTANGYDRYNGERQVYALDSESNIKQYYRTSAFPLTFSEYKQSLESIAYLTEAFMRNYERPSKAGEVLDLRISYSNYWYEYLSGKPPVPPIPTRTFKKLPLWAYTKRRY